MSVENVFAWVSATNVSTTNEEVGRVKEAGSFALFLVRIDPRHMPKHGPPTSCDQGYRREEFDVTPPEPKRRGCEGRQGAESKPTGGNRSSEEEKTKKEEEKTITKENEKTKEENNKQR